MTNCRLNSNRKSLCASGLGPCATMALRAGIGAAMVLSLSACAPPIRELGVPLDTVKDLPQEEALGFLQTLLAYDTDLGQKKYKYFNSKICGFSAEGVFRFDPIAKGVLAGVLPYRIARVATSIDGRKLQIYPPDASFFVPGGGEWCLIDVHINAQELGMDEVRLMRKTLTALLSIGIRPIGSQGP